MQVLIPMLTELELQVVGIWYHNLEKLSQFDAHQKLRNAADRYLHPLITLAAVNSASESSHSGHSQKITPVK